MRNLLRKEVKLTASILSFLFIAFGLLTICPGYPILVGGFFVTLGIFQTFQSAREANDIVYSALLPISKADVVRSKYIFCIFIELCAFLLSAAITLLRMTVLVNAAPYRTNALMNANLVFLGFLLIIFACFNSIFVCGFFKTGYNFAKPFVTHIVVTFVIVTIAESLHHIPGLQAVNSFGFENIGLQLACLISGVIIYILVTLLSMKQAIKLFETIDL